jgi:glycine/D-amino acid oxidase-like deaminating enzyme
MNAPDIVAMQRQHEDRLRATRRWLIAETDEGFEVHEWTVDGVAPWAEKATKEEGAARLLQLMGIKHAIIPQAYPERVCVGNIVTKDES